MGIIFNFSLRNLLKQRRRNLLLGVGIAFGIMIMVVVNSFARGMVDVLITDVVSIVYGHVKIQSMENNYTSIVRDRERIVTTIKETVKKDDLIAIREGVEMSGRAIGNGAAANIAIIGIAPVTETEKRDFFNNLFTLKTGNFADFYQPDIEYPVIISERKAKLLNVKVHDKIKFRLVMVTGQIQTAQLTVVAIADAKNSILNTSLFMEVNGVKKLMGYKPWESAGVQITLRNSQQTAKYYADLLHQKLKSPLISFTGEINRNPAYLLAFKNDSSAIDLLKKEIRIIRGNPDGAFSKTGVMLSKNLANLLRLQPGSEFIYQFPTKYQGQQQELFKVDAIFESNSSLGQNNIILVNGERIYDLYNRFAPQNNSTGFLQKGERILTALATEWKLLDRSSSDDEMLLKYKVERKINSNQAKYDIQTMYETASSILDIEKSLNNTAFIAVLILFFIILTGMVNALRMSIKERTREIGTVRSIGMQKKDVRKMFITETMLLAFFSCLAGILIGIILIWILSLIRFDSSNALSFVLRNQHLFFKLDPMAILLDVILIIMISGLVSYFPARRAARISPVKALRHYE